MERPQRIPDKVMRAKGLLETGLPTSIFPLQDRTALPIICCRQIIRFRVWREQTLSLSETYQMQHRGLLHPQSLEIDRRRKEHTWRN